MCRFGQGRVDNGGYERNNRKASKRSRSLPICQDIPISSQAHCALFVVPEVTATMAWCAFLFWGCAV